MTSLRRVANPGGGVIPGGLGWNEIIQRLELLERATFRDGSRESALPIMHNRAWMWAQNDTGQQLGDRAILQINSTVVPDSQDAVVGVGLPMDCSKVVIGFKPNPAGSRRLMCVVVSGYAIADVNVQQEHLDDPDWNCSATVVIGDHTQLISDLKGGVQIISPVVAAGLQEVVVRVGNSASCNVPSQDEFDQKCQEIDDQQMDLDDLKDCLCTLVDDLETEGSVTPAQAQAYRDCAGCDAPPMNPVNEACPSGCPTPQFMNVDVTGTFPWRMETGGFPAVQELRFQEIGVGTRVYTATDNDLVQAAFETLLLQQWPFDTGGGCLYPDIPRDITVSIPGTTDVPLGPPADQNVPATMTELRFRGTLSNTTGVWEFAILDIQATIDGVGYFANTPGGDALGPAITAGDLLCADRGSFPDQFANSGGLIDGGTGEPFIIWALTDIILMQP